MILTGKAKLDFENWIYEKGVTGEIDLSNFEFDKFEFLSKTSQYAIITDWLDSVGIYIEVLVTMMCEGVNPYFTSVINTNKLMYTLDNRHKTRHEATEVAIKLANDLYNGNK